MLENIGSDVLYIPYTSAGVESEAERRRSNASHDLQTCISG